MATSKQFNAEQGLSVGTGNVVIDPSGDLTTQTISGRSNNTNISITPQGTGTVSVPSINKVAITAPATGATLAIADGRTFTVSKNLTLTSNTESAVTVNFGNGGTIAFEGGGFIYDNVASLLSLTAVGTIGTGTWQATPVGIAYGGTGSNLVDPGADRIMFWDDSAGSGGQTAWLSLGSSLGITGTVLNTTQDLTTGGTPTFAGLTINGNLNITGTQTVLNVNELSIDDKNLTLGDVVAKASLNFTSSVGSTIVSLTSGDTSGMIPGQIVTVASGTLTLGANTTVASITNATQFVLSAAFGGSGTSGTLNIAGASDYSADGGGITIKGATDKTFTWDRLSNKFKLNNGLDVTSGSGTSSFNTTVGSGVVGLLQLQRSGTTKAIFALDGSDNFAIYNAAGNVQNLTLTDSGNLGIGVTPSAWGSFIPRAIELPNGVGFASQSNSPVAHFSANAYYDGSWRYKANNVAALYSVGAETFNWYNATTGTAGNAISWSQRMTLDASGNLGVGISPFSKLHVSPSSSAGNQGTVAITLGNETTSGRGAQIVKNTSSPFELKFISSLNASNGVNTVFERYPGAESMRIDDTGRLLVGTTTANAKLTFGESSDIAFNTSLGSTGTYGSIKAFNVLAPTNPATNIRFIRDVATVGNDGAICFDTVNTERVRIDSSGIVLVGSTTGQAFGRMDVKVWADDVNYSAYLARSFAAGTGDGSTTVTVTRAVNSANNSWANARYHAYQHTWGVFGAPASSNAMVLDISGNLTIIGTLYAAAKSFKINHPTKPNKKLVHGSLEGPENGVYVRGRTKSNVIELPDYWTALIDPESITVQLTPMGKHQKLYVEKIEDNKVFIANDNLLNKSINCFYFIQAERVDIDKLKVESDE